MTYKDPRRYVKHWPNVLKDSSYAPLFREDCLEKPQHSTTTKFGSYAHKKPLSANSQLFHYARTHGLTAAFFVSSIGPSFFSFEARDQGVMQYTPGTKECAIQQKNKRGIRWVIYRVKNAYQALRLFIKVKPVRRKASRSVRNIQSRRMSQGERITNERS